MRIRSLLGSRWSPATHTHAHTHTHTRTHTPYKRLKVWIEASCQPHCVTVGPMTSPQPLQSYASASTHTHTSSGGALIPLWLIFAPVWRKSMTGSLHLPPPPTNAHTHAKTLAGSLCFYLPPYCISLLLVYLSPSSSVIHCCSSVSVPDIRGSSEAAVLCLLLFLLYTVQPGLPRLQTSPLPPQHMCIPLSPHYCFFLLLYIYLCLVFHPPWPPTPLSLHLSIYQLFLSFHLPASVSHTSIHPPPTLSLPLAPPQHTKHKFSDYFSSWETLDTTPGLVAAAFARCHDYSLGA